MTYREGAEKYYDLFGEKDDAPFYIDLAHHHGDKALELGVGTARLAIQLARVGIETWGIDNSHHMLKAAEANIVKEPLEVRNRLHIRRADARGFNLKERFGLIYFPSFSFDHILKREDQVATLEAVHRHLSPDGVYAFDLAHVPNLKVDRGWFVQRRALDEHRMVVRTGFHRTDPEKHLMSIDLWYELIDEGRIVERYFEGGEVYIHTKDGIRELLEEAGYEVKAWYGGYKGQIFSEKSEMMVIVAQPI
jgi:SAM-dependent methyltransferase